MINPEIILNEPDIVKRNSELRGVDVDVDKVRDLILKVRERVGGLDNLRAEANLLAKSISGVSDNERGDLIEKGRVLKGSIKDGEDILGKLEDELEGLLLRIPNILQDDVPEGISEEENEVVRIVGDIPEFNFDVKDHMELGLSLGIFDKERASKVSGSRFVYLKGDGALLELAIVNYAIGLLIERGFEPVLPPHLISTEAMGAMGYLQHGGDDEIYHLKDDDLVLIGTSEQAIGPMFMNEVLEEGSLPLRMSGYSPCYRREAGSYGKDVAGILRMHQFDKIEMFSFVAPEDSVREHEMLLGVQEELMQGLGLPYRVMKLCAGDLGSSSSKTYDIETWMPGQDTYRETHSTSNTTEYQTRRLNTRLRREGGNIFPHALNGTAFAVGRILIAILENGQQSDGSVVIPEVLRGYMGNREALSIDK